MFMVPNPSGSSKGIIIKEERPNTPPQIYYQDSQDPEDDFLPLSQLLQEFQTPPQQEQGQSSRVISQSEPIITHPPSQCRSLCIPRIVHAKGCPQYNGPTYLEQCTLFCEPHGANCHKSCVNYRRFESSSSSDDYGMNHAKGCPQYDGLTYLENYFLQSSQSSQFGPMLLGLAYLTKIFFLGLISYSKPKIFKSFLLVSDSSPCSNRTQTSSNSIIWPSPLLIISIFRPSY